ncbi:hypothetical protein ACFLXJ_03110 [Chloroflexota bacterium]
MTALLLVLLFFTGCGPGYSTTAGSSGYTELTVKRGIARFSFEYPSHYKIGKVEIRNDYHYIDMIVYGQSPGEEVHNPIIDVFVNRTSASMPNIQGAIDAELSVADNRPFFHFLERSPVKVTTDSIPGEKIIFSWASYPDIAPTTEPIHYISNSVFFEYGNLIWSIDMRSEINEAASDESVYNHILQTFRILD